jgi:hypothetical protein
VEWITVWLAVGTVAGYLLVAFVLYRHTFKEAEPDRFERALLAFAPVLHVFERLAERFTKESEHDEPGDRRHG